MAEASTRAAATVIPASSTPLRTSVQQHNQQQQLQEGKKLHLHTVMQPQSCRQPQTYVIVTMHE